LNWQSRSGLYETAATFDLKQEVKMTTAMPKPIPGHVAANLLHDFNCEDPAMRTDPYEAYGKLQDAPKVFYNREGRPGWVVHKYDDIRFVLQSPELFTSKGIMSNIDNRSEDSGMGGFQMIPLELDPPHHGRYRAMLNPVFAPKRVDMLDSSIRALSIELIESFKAKGECEFITEFAQKLPTTIFLQMLGLPVSRLPDFLQWEKDLLHSNNEELQTAAGMSIYVYLAERINERMNEPPGEDIISQLLQQEVEGERIGIEDLLGFCMMFFVAGLDTVTNALGNAFFHFAKNPDQLAQLVASPDMIPDAVEETLRAFSVIVTQRFVRVPTELHGAKMEPGDLVTILLPSGNLDPAKYSNPMLVDFARGANDHLAFAAGPHRCMGSHLARRELRIAIEEFIKHIPKFSLKPGVDVEMNVGIIGPSALHLVW
jgi:cytochrome P450